MEKEAKIIFVNIMYLSIAIVTLFIIFNISPTFATSSGSNGTANLTIWTGGTSNGNNRTFGTIFSKTTADWNFLFYANYTNSSNFVINQSNGNGACQIRFNQTGTYDSLVNMSYNSSSLLWQYNVTFNYKGNLSSNVNCNSTFGNISLVDYFTVRNTRPLIAKDEASGEMTTLSCTEDILCTFNITTNVTEDDFNDRSSLTFAIISANTTLTNYTLTSIGFLTVNKTNMNTSSSEKISFTVTDGGSDSGTDVATLPVSTTAVNDAPVFVNLANQSFNMSTLFEYIINVTDEENNIPFTFNITFLNCTVASWSSRNCSNSGSNGRDLFNSSQYTTNGTSGQINISFKPTRNDVGNYTINFTVTDSGTTNPANATTSKIINFEVLNINSLPYFRYVCDNERNTTENSLFNCYINITDLDETLNVTMTANYTWFKFNDTGTNSTQVPINSTTNFNGSAIVNFTATDTEVGNWSVNVSLTDRGNPIGRNSTVFYFFIANVNDSVSLDAINNLTAYTSNNYTIYVNATDDDLLIPDKNVLNETLTFTSNHTNVTINSTTYISGTNKTQAAIFINPNLLPQGNTTVNITVQDKYNFSISSRIFRIEVLTNNPPVWNATLQTNHSLIEDTNFYLNLSQNVSDPDVGDIINFTFSNDTAFPSFTINATTGVINFTPVDGDVGRHIVIINASDGKTPSPKTFNLTVNNTLDAPILDSPRINSVINGSTDGSTHVNATEDNKTTINIFIFDNDFLIPQKTFCSTCNEQLTVNVTIQGPNTTLLTFSQEAGWPVGNKTLFALTFTPMQADVGSYNITLNFTDVSNLSVVLSFNLTVFLNQDPPNMTRISDIVTSIIEILYIDVNTTDEEDINETVPGSNLTYTITNLTANGNFLTINRTTGVINLTLNQTHAGNWSFNVSVNDSSGKMDSDTFVLTVYDYPKILSPNSTTQFNFKENVSMELNFTVNHTVGDNLNYTLIILGALRNSTSGYGNGSAFLWNFTANFTDETTCTGAINLTLNVSNQKLSNSTTWNLTINHTNYNLTFTGSIGGSEQKVTGGSSATVTLSTYFIDIDASDFCRNQTIGFIYTFLTGDSQTVSITNWTNYNVTPEVTFSSSSTTKANYSITAFEYNSSNYSTPILGNATSNNFTVELTVTTVSTPAPSSGGGSSRERPISLKIIVPEPVSAKKKDKLIVPIRLVNDGEVDLNEIVLSSLVAKSGLIRSDLIASFDKTFFRQLRAGQSENVTMIVDLDTTETGIFEVTINGTVKNPKYSDWSKFYIEIKEEETVIEKIIFTEELIIGNPVCAELKDLIEEAKELYSQGRIEESRRKADEVLEACRQAIEQPPSPRVFERIADNFVTYLVIAIVSAITIGFGYYYYKRWRMKRALSGLADINKPEE